MYNSHLEQLTSFATAEPFSQEVLAAKAEYFSFVGEIFEDDRSFDQRMSAFLEFYLFDRPLASKGQTPAGLFLAERGPGLSQEDRAGFEGFTHTHHSLFEVRKLTDAGVRVRDLFTAHEDDVFERRSMAGMRREDVMEARLIPFAGRLHFAPAFCYHPQEARKAILKEIKQQLKKPSPGFTPRSMMFALSRMSLKLDRYRNIAVENIYTFDGASGRW